MQINLINHRFLEALNEFENKNFKRKWDILVMVVEGEYNITFKHTQKKLTLVKNDIALIPAEVEFERRISSQFTGFFISFYSQVDHPYYLCAPMGKLKLPREQTEAIFKTMERAAMLPDNRELIIHIVEHIFAENYLFGETEKVKFRPFSEEINTVTRYMRAHLSEKIDIDKLAELVYLSHSGLIWKFRQELNTTPSNYLKILRLRYAKQLLLNYPYSITEISEMCGYSSPYYFTNAFRGYTGISPTDFRRMHLKGK